MLNKILFVGLLSVVLALVVNIGFVLAQDDNSQSPEQQDIVSPVSDIDSSVAAAETPEPNLLPDSHWYFLKTWQRAIKTALTFDKVKKAELQLKIATEKLQEAKKLAQKTANPKLIKKATQKYQEAMDRVSEKIDKIKENASSSPKMSKFLEQVEKQKVLHQNILEKLESKVPTSTFEKIQAAREKHIEKFEQIKEKLQEKIGNRKLIGGDKDGHGCLIAAGYSWCEAKQKCLRVWEEPCATTTTDSEGPNPVPRGPLNRLRNKLQNLLTK